jgi:hypothetical protein
MPCRKATRQIDEVYSKNTPQRLANKFANTYACVRLVQQQVFEPNLSSLLPNSQFSKIRHLSDPKRKITEQSLLRLLRFAEDKSPIHLAFPDRRGEADNPRSAVRLAQSRGLICRKAETITSPF